jgi:DNA-binding HxlR family transcriptional regulator
MSPRAKKCPVGMDLAALGKKWTFHILMDIGMLHIDRFNQILRSLPGLTPRVLIMRLNELQDCGLIQAITIQERPRLVRWELTEKGRDTVPILEGYTSYVTKWHPNASLRNHLKAPIKYPSIPELIEIERRWNNQLDSMK